MFAEIENITRFIVAKRLNRNLPSVVSTWKRLERYFKKYAPAIYKDLEKTIRRSLPDDVKQSLLCHDGQRDPAILSVMRLNTN